MAEDKITVLVEAEVRKAVANLKVFETEASSTTKKAEGGFSRLSSTLLSVKTLIGGAVVGALIGLGKALVGQSAKMEQTRIAFESMLGSAEKAGKVIKQLQNFSIVTPYTIDQVNQAAKTLLAFGTEGEDLQGTLKILGDVASGTGADLNQMALVFGQIQSTGRLMGQDLLQLINAGFNPLQVISEQTGRSMKDLKKDMEQGRISFDMVKQAFISVTSEGGKFYNLMEKQSRSLSGRFSTLIGNLQLFAATMGDKLAPAVGWAVDGLIKLTSVGEPTETTIVDIVTASKEFNDINKKLTSTTDILTRSERARLNVLQAIKDQDIKKNIEALNKEYLKLKKSAKSAMDDYVELQEAMIRREEIAAISPSAKIEKEIVKLADRVDAAHAKWTEYDDAVYDVEKRTAELLHSTKLTSDQLKVMDPTLLRVAQGIEIVKEETKKTTETFEELGNGGSKNIDKVDDSLERLKALLKEASDLGKSQHELELQQYTEKIAMLDDFRMKYQDNTEILIDIDRARYQFLEEMERMRHEQQINNMLLIMDQASSVFDSIGSYQQAMSDNRLAALEREKAAVMEAAATEEERSRLESEYNAKAGKERQRAAKQQKAVGILSAIVNTAAGVVKAFADYGWPMGLIPAAAIGIAGGLQIAKIAQTDVPAYARGGSFVTDGPQMFIAGDNPGGKERIDVTPLSSELTDAANNAPASSQTKVFNFYGIQDLSQARNALMREEGSEAFA